MGELLGLFKVIIQERPPIRVNSKLYDFLKNDGRITVVAPKLWLGE